MNTNFRYFELRHALQVHDIVIRESGGLSGVKDQGAIESILTHMRNDICYPEFEHKLTHLVFSVIKHHAFNDGKKRTSIALGAYFLEINGLDFCVTHFIRELENIVVWVAQNKIDKELLKELLLAMISYEEFEESLKLRLVNAISV